MTKIDTDKNTNRRPLLSQVSHISVSLPKALHRQMKIRAVNDDITLSELVRKATYDYMSVQVVKQTSKVLPGQLSL